MSELLTITLAAGRGTRMKSKLPKVLHKVAGKSMLQHVTNTATALNPEKNIVIIGYKGDMVKDSTNNLTFIEQEEQLGTGHAVKQAAEEIKGFSGIVLVLYGDTPLLTESTLQQLIDKHIATKAAISILTTKVDDPTGYGRIVRNDEGQIIKIIEEDDTTEEEAQIKEINTGICAFDAKLLSESLTKLDNDNAQGEYYLTDVVKILAQQNKVISGLLTTNYQETIGVNTRRHLVKANKVLQERVCNYHLDNGVTILDPANTYIDSEVEIGRDTIIYPFTMIEGDTSIGEEVIIGPQSRIVDSQIANGVEVQNSTIISAKIEDNVEVGPYAYIRPQTTLKTGVKVGDFVEIKKSEIGHNSKVPHLSYIGDAEIGSNSNIGAGTITANYDGMNKYQTKIGDNVFIGSDSTLIAPVEIGTNATTGAGSVVKDNVATADTVVGVPAKSINKADK